MVKVFLMQNLSSSEETRPEEKLKPVNVDGNAVGGSQTACRCSTEALKNRGWVMVKFSEKELRR